MPRYRFAAPLAYQFPASRDARGIPLGTVEPGDVRDLDEPPGLWWVPADAIPAAEGAAGGGSGDGPVPSPVPDGPQPAPPAVMPASPATQTSEAGVTGSEE